ncbi:hypothetical protein Barb6_02194 [Bacteroidales bacterium Barb6]|nr:hypothetical protein Barb6_02194 [Bacteroidales bacterium Barb6]
MCMLHGGKKGGQGLTGERAPALCGQGDGKHNGQVFPRFLQCLLYRFQSRLCIQGVKHRFQQENINTACNQTFRLLLIGNIHILIGDGTIGRVVHIGTHGSRLVGRPH